MKREIKFRAWNGKQMLQNVGTHPHMMKSLVKIPNCDNQDSDCEYKKDDEGAYIISQAFDAYTLMQFTGLKDKNGKEIYESDIVKVHGQFEVPYDDRKDFEIITYEHIGTVSFSGGCFVFKNHLSIDKLIELRKVFEDESLNTDITSSIDSFLAVEIIGNVYENSDLLK